MPTTNSVDVARGEAVQFITALINPHPASPFAPIAESQMKALRQLAEIFTHITKPQDDTIVSPRVNRNNAHPRVLDTPKNNHV